VLDIPYGHPLTSKEGLWLQTGHQHPMVGGHVTRQTPVDPAKLSILQQTLDPALLDLAGADVVIVHRSWITTPDIEDFAEAQLGDPFYEDDRFLAFEVPEPDDAPRFVALPSTSDEITGEADSYLFLPDAAAVTLHAALSSDGRDVTLLVDWEPTQVWTVDGNVTIDVSVALDAGYHTLSLTVDPPCPPDESPALECRAVELNELTITDRLSQEPSE
jgi:hypothetical protein